MYVYVCESVCMFFQLIWHLMSSSNSPASTTLNVGGGIVITGEASQACFVGSGIKALDFMLLQQAPIPSEPIFL